MRVFHQVTTTDEHGNTDSTLDVNGWFLAVAVVVTLSVVDSLIDSLSKMRDKKKKYPPNACQ